jgi:hypothetical protein
VNAVTQNKKDSFMHPLDRLSAELAKKALKDVGWFNPDQLKGKHSDADPINFIGTRKLTNHYQFIPLSIMMTFSKKDGINFQSFEKDDFEDYKVILSK